MTPRRNEPGPWAAIIAGRMPRGTTQRVRANRRLRQTGALAVRPGVYALPDSAGGREALAAAAREVARQRGTALRCVVSWLDPGDEEQLRIRYDAQHAGKRDRLLKHIGALERAVAGASRTGAAVRRTARARLARLRKHLERQVDHVHPGRIDSPRGQPVPPPVPTTGGTSYRGRTWVTRRGVLIDRIASAWLILRFVDRQARFQFVGPGTSAAAGALRFDMAEADFGHEGDRCTFETLVAHFRGGDPALRQIAEIVHDLDIRDGKYGRAEAPGVALVIAGLAAATSGDEERIQQGRWLFDFLYASLRGPAPRLPKGVQP